MPCWKGVYYLHQKTQCHGRNTGASSCGKLVEIWWLSAALRYHPRLCVSTLLPGLGYSTVWFLFSVQHLVTQEKEGASKYMMDSFVCRPLVTGWTYHIRNYYFIMWPPGRLMSCDLRNVCAIPLQFRNIKVLVLWLFFFVFVHSKANLQYNIVIKVSISCVPDILLAWNCRTTTVE